MGYIMMAGSGNVETYASAQIFYSAGSTGLQILQQVFIADTSDFLNRALFSSLPDSPFLVTVWIGPAIAGAILGISDSSWRWGYGMWAVILPVAFLPLALSLYLNSKKAEKLGILTKRRPSAGSGSPIFSSTLFQDLDVVGSLLLSGGLSLVLIPLTLVSRSPQGWPERGYLAMILTGFALLLAFPMWESRPSLAPHPLLPLELLKSRTFCAGCGLGFFYFMIFYIAVQPYFYSYLLVALNMTIEKAGPITQTFSFASTIAALLASLAIRQSGAARPRLFIIGGASLYTLAVVILLHTRTRGASVAVLVGAQTVLGAGAGLMHVATQLLVQASCGDRHAYVGVATAAFMTLVEVGAAVGSSLSGAVWGSLVPHKLAMYLPDMSKEELKKIYASVKVAQSYAWGSPEREAIARAYQETITVLLRFALIVCIPMLGMALLVGDYRVDSTGQVRQGLVIGNGTTDAGSQTDPIQEPEQGGIRGRFSAWRRERGRNRSRSSSSSERSSTTEVDGNGHSNPRRRRSRSPSTSSGSSASSASSTRSRQRDKLLSRVLGVEEEKASWWTPKQWARERAQRKLEEALKERAERERQRLQEEIKARIERKRRKLEDAVWTRIAQAVEAVGA